MKRISFVKRTLSVTVATACIIPSMVYATTMPTETASPYAATPIDLQGATFIPPNVMLFLDTSGSMTSRTDSSTNAQGNTNNRMNVAARVVTNLFENNKNVRWGLFTFDNRRQGSGTTIYDPTYSTTPLYSLSGVLRQAIDDYDSPNHISGLTDTVEVVRKEVDVSSWGTNTPLSEAYVEMVHYFAGLQSVYGKLPYPSTVTKSGSRYYTSPNNSSRYESPIQYRCQKNFIIAVTDGIPTADDQFRNDPILGNLSGLGADTLNDLPVLTKRAFEGDLLQGLSGQPTTDLDGGSYEDSDFRRQFITTYTVGFSLLSDKSGQNAVAMLKKAASNGGGQYFGAGDESSLTSAFQSAINDIVDKTSSVPAPVSVSQPSSGTIQVGFDTADWSGSVTTRTVDAFGNISTTGTKATVPAAADRIVFTNHNKSGTGRDWRHIDTSISDMVADTTTFGSKPEYTLKFLRGETPSNDSSWRKRSSDKLLGDFINTEPVSLNGGLEFAAGSNDGLVHYFRRSNLNSAFEELFAFAPSATLSKTQYVAQPNYGQSSNNPHRYLVDGALVAQDLFTPENTSKGNILVGALGRGGKGLYALNLTNIIGKDLSAIPKNDQPRKIGLWDLNSEDYHIQSAGAKMGYTVGRPVIAQVKRPASESGVLSNNSRWAVITGNGYDAATNGSKRSGVYMFDALGAGPNFSDPIIGTVEIPTEGDNPGIGGIAVMDKDNDGVADVIYAGDRNGDLWRITLAEKLEDSVVHKLWDGDATQPITMTPTLYRVNTSEVMVLFGTGSMLKDTDKTNKDQQSIYGIRDDLSKTLSYSYSSDRGTSGKLLEQTITSTTVPAANQDETYRQVSQKVLPSDGSKSGGWFLNLSTDGNSSERITQPITVAGGGIWFTTQIPSVEQSDMCTGSSSDGWVMTLSAVTGAGPLKPVIDPALVTFPNGTTTAVAGYKSKKLGMPSALSLISTGGESGNSIYWSNYATQSGMINNQLNYNSSALLKGLGIYMTCKDGSACGKTTLSVNSFMQGYRTSWQEVI